MVNIVFEGDSIDVEENEILLDALLRQGHDVAYGCRGGVCHSCMLIADESTLSRSVFKKSQASLSEGEKRLNYFLACQCQIEAEDFSKHEKNSVHIARIDNSHKKETVKIIEKEWLNKSVLCLRLDSSLAYKPGQFITVSTTDDGVEVARSYSIASQPQLNNYIELHIKYIEEGHFSRLIKDNLDVGDSLNITGPMGKCIYSADPNQVMLLSAIGTGLAPIYGILQDALNQAHAGDIHLVVGAKSDEDFYLMDELRVIRDKHSNVHLHFVTLESQSSDVSEDLDRVHKSDVYDYVNKLLSDMKDTKVYLCGRRIVCEKMRRQSFMNGASMKDIQADIFLPFAP